MILYFSGTGNSLVVARQLAELLGERLVNMLDATPGDIPAGEPLGFVFPIYAWGLPRVVERAIERLAVASPAWTWMAATCGDDIGLTHLQMRDAIAARGWTLAAAFSFRLPNTYVGLPGFDVDGQDEIERRMLAVGECCALVAEQLKTLRRTASPRTLSVVDVVEGKMAWVKSKWLRPAFNRFLTGDRHFRVEDACIHCGKCERACPVRNIRLGDDRRPQWQGRCADCYACYHVCPVHAIRYGAYTDKKGQKPLYS